MDNIYFKSCRIPIIYYFWGALRHLISSHVISYTESRTRWYRTADERLTPLFGPKRVTGMSNTSVASSSTVNLTFTNLKGGWDKGKTRRARHGKRVRSQSA